MAENLFTSESVGEGHPDKVCDRISDAILDKCLEGDPNSRVAAEVQVATQYVSIVGEVTTRADVDFKRIARDTIREIGYDKPGLGFDADSAEVVVRIHAQSPDISQGVTEGEGLFKEQGAGDQGLMFGFACRDTPSLMPLPIDLAHQIVRRAKELRLNGKMPYIFPDCKSQVTVAHRAGRPTHIDTVVFSTHHSPNVDLETIRADSLEKIIKPVCGDLLRPDTKFYVNPTGRFVEGGPAADAGLTGRKIIVDTYGGMGHHGGGAFSGKDPSKVDRSAAYAARWVAKNIVAAELAEKCELQVAYAIGVADPINITVDTFGAEHVPVYKIEEAVREVFDLTPAGIIKNLKLKRPIYGPTAFGGHFGQKAVGGLFTWEETNRIQDLITAVQKH